MNNILRAGLFAQTILLLLALFLYEAEGGALKRTWTDGCTECVEEKGRVTCKQWCKGVDHYRVPDTIPSNQEVMKKNTISSDSAKTLSGSLPVLDVQPETWVIKLQDGGRALEVRHGKSIYRFVPEGGSIQLESVRPAP